MDLVVIDETLDEQIIIKREIDHSIELADNAMLKHRPDLFDEWDFEKNDELGLDVYKITKANGNRAWWIGKCGHNWITAVSHRSVRNTGCPYCATSNQKTLKGYNDMWTTNPELANNLWNSSDGFKYKEESHKKVDWKCKECGDIVKNKTIQRVNKKEVLCRMCSDGISYPEKLTMDILNQLEIYYEYNYVFHWSEGKIYDFYISSLNMIIETHGEQHYRENNRGRSLKEEQVNDTLKEHLAKENGIDMYYVIDCSYSDINYIKNNYFQSSISNFLNLENINWLDCDRNAMKSFVRIASNYWNIGIRNINEISEILKVSRPTTRKYLKQASKLQWCDYDAKEILTERSIRNGIARRKKVVQLTKGGEYIKEWGYAQEASNELKIGRPSITSVCNGKKSTAGGFKWMYSKEYYKEENDIIVHG